MPNSISELLNSKRFWSAVAGIVSMIVVAIVPTLADQAEQLTTILFAVVMALVTGYTITDVQEAKRQ